MRRLQRPKGFHTQVLLLFLLVVMLPMVVLSVYLYDDIVHSAEMRLALQLENTARQWMTGYQGRKEQIQTLAHMISNNPVFTNYMTSRQEKDADFIKTTRNSFRPMLEWLITTNDTVYRIHFFTDNQELPEGKYITHLSRLSEDALGEQLQQAGPDGRLLPVNRARRLPYETVSEHPLVSTYQTRMPGKPTAYLQLDIAADWLYDDLALAVDRHTGVILYSSLDAALIGQPFAIRQQETAPDPFRIRTATLLGESYYWDTDMLQDESVLFVSLIPAAAVHPQLQDARQNYIITCLALAVLMLTMGGFIARRVTRRVKKIGQMVEQISQDQYTVHYPSHYNDEIDLLGRSVQEMGVKMDRLVNQGLRQSLLTKEAEFRALQAQINPHFIFNTLESFQMLAELEGLTTLSDMMGLLGKLMRYNLERTPTVPLRLEIENVADYVAVQNLSWNGRVLLETDLDERLLDLEVLRLMLQPVVENAIVHGMPPAGSLRIVIRICQEGERLVLRIANDGNSMQTEEARRLDQLLQEARLSPVSTATGSIALQNIQRRLMIQYGADCLIHIDQTWTPGFSVEFSLPLKKER